MNDFIAASVGAPLPGRESWNGLGRRPAAGRPNQSHYSPWPSVAPITCFYPAFSPQHGRDTIIVFLSLAKTHLDDFVTGCEALDCGGAAGLNRGHKNADIVAPRQTDAHTSLLLEADKSWIRPAIPRW